MPHPEPLALCLALLAASACAGERSQAPPGLDPAPSDGASAAPASAPPAGASPQGGPNVPGPPGPPPPDGSPIKPSPPPRSWKVYKDGKAFLDIRDEPGRIIDTNAPLPPPGVTIPPHPFLSGECGGGEIKACSKAGELLRASSSTKEFIAKLRDAGFVVRELKPGAP